MPSQMFTKRSKRSSRVALTTMVALGGGMLLSACGDGSSAPAAKAAAPEEKTEVTVFENVFECAANTGKSREECEAMHQEAVQEASVTAPRFAALQDCEREYGEGKCVESTFAREDAQEYGRGHYSPFIVAWFSSKNRGNAPLFASGSEGYQTANGTRLGFAGQPGKYHATSRALERSRTIPAVKPASKVAQRGGFGTRTGAWNLKDRSSGGASRSATAATRTAARSKGG